MATTVIITHLGITEVPVMRVRYVPTSSDRGSYVRTNFMLTMMRAMVTPRLAILSLHAMTRYLLRMSRLSSPEGHHIQVHHPDRPESVGFHMHPVMSQPISICALPNNSGKAASLAVETLVQELSLGTRGRCHKWTNPYARGWCHLRMCVLNTSPRVAMYGNSTSCIAIYDNTTAL